MATRPIQLVRYREASSQRAHFAIFVPDVGTPGQGTLIHVVGSPMTGFLLEFKRQYDLEATSRHYDLVTIAQIPAQHVAILPNANLSRPDLPRTNLERVAGEIQPPRPSQNFMGPVDGVVNRRCQEWTIDYVRRLVQHEMIPQAAVDLVQQRRDPPTHGVGLNAVGVGRGQGGGRGQATGPGGWWSGRKLRSRR